MRARAEPFGAWVQLQRPAALVAVNRPLAARLGIDGTRMWAPGAAGSGAPLEVHMAVTGRCGAGCTGCYLDATPEGIEPPFDDLVGRLRAIANAGVFTVAFGGGEPLSRDDLGELATTARALGLTPVMTTSGIGMTPARARELLAFSQVNVSYDGVAEAYRAVRGFDGARVAERAMEMLRQAGVSFGVNVVLTRATFEHTEATAARATELGAVEIQLLRFKPAGRGTGLPYYAARLTPEQVDAVPSLLERLVARDIRVRIDCAMVPFLSVSSVDPSALERFGVFGCEAGRHLAAATVSGTLSPCSFSAPSATAVLDLAASWPEDRLVKSFLHHASAPPAPCNTCPLRASCRGGCRVVAAHAGDPTGPDPECPRVRAHQAGGRG